MKRSRMKLFACVLSVALVLSVGASMGINSNRNEANAVTETTTQNQTTNNSGQVTTFNLMDQGNSSTKKLTLQELKDKALQIIPGTIIDTEYDYEMGKELVNFKIVDSNGVAREVELEVMTGKVYDIDYDYDADGNRFINQSLFEVNKTFEQCQQTALEKIPGGQVLNSKQDADYGLFIYEFIIKGTDGLIYEVDVETKNGTVIKVELTDDYNEGSYDVPKVILGGGTTGTASNGAVSQAQFLGTNTTTDPTPAPAPAPQPTPAPAPAPQPVPAPDQQSVSLSEADLRNKVLSRYPGTVLNYYTEWDDGRQEHKYVIKQNDGTVVKVEITSGGYITDVDFEGKYVNGQYYDDDYYDWD